MEMFDDISELLKKAGNAIVPPDFTQRLLERAQQRGNPPRKGLRASNCTAPLLYQILDARYPAEKQFTLAQSGKIFFGTYAEELVCYVLELAGYHLEREVRCVAGLYTGHADVVVKESPNSHAKLVLEIKSSDTWGCSKLRKDPSDEYGYVSQLAFYYATTRSHMAAFVTVDRCKLEMRLVPMSTTVLDAKFRAVMATSHTASDVIWGGSSALLSLPAPHTKLPIEKAATYPRWGSMFYEPGLPPTLLPYATRLKNLEKFMESSDVDTQQLTIPGLGDADNDVTYTAADYDAASDPDSSVNQDNTLDEG
jgi:hypothetical protein